MSDKVRMKVTVTFEYNADPENYDEISPISMADIDRMNFKGDVDHLFDTMVDYPLNITVEPINGND